MPHSDLPAKIASDTFDLSDYNIIKDNFDAGATDAMQAAGDIIYGTGADALTRLALGTQDSFLVAGASAPAWQIAPACRVTNNADIDPTTSTWYTLTFNTEAFDPDGMHSTVSNTGRITVPTNGDGIYVIGGTVDIAASGAGTSDFGIQVLYDGATVIARWFSSMTKESSITLNISTLYSMTATHYVELQVYTESDFDVKTQSAYSPLFWAHWLRVP